VKSFREELREIIKIFEEAVEGRSEGGYAINWQTNDVVNKILHLISQRLPKKKDKNFDDDPYCRTCRLSETFCQCEGFNQALSQVKKELGIDESNKKNN